MNDSGSNRWDYYSIAAINIDSEEDVGFIKIAVLSKENFEKYFGDILKFADSKGRRLKVADIPEDNLPERTRKEFKKNNPKTQEGKIAIMKELIWNGDEIIEALKSEKEINDKFRKCVNRLKLELGESYKKFTLYHLEKPEVHYVDVKEKFKRQGVASLLYDIGSEMLKSEGYKLYSSTTQTKEAENLWKNRKDAKKDELTQRYYIESNSPKLANKKVRRSNKI